MKRKKDLVKEVEQIEAMGQESETKAIPVVTEVMKEREKNEEKQKQEDLEILHDKKRWSFKTYNELIADLLKARISMIQFPPGWNHDIAITDKGVVLSMGYGGRYFRAGFRPTGQEKYDLNAITMYAVRAENTIDRIMTLP